MEEHWQVYLSNRAEKQYEKLKRNGVKPSVIDLIDYLIAEIEVAGPERKNWPHYGKLSESTYHCHLKKGRPTFVACWQVVNKEGKKIEVYYVGTHEGAPY